MDLIPLKCSGGGEKKEVIHINGHSEKSISEPETHINPYKLHLVGCGCSYL
jgi:hypothetical protein